MFSFFTSKCLENREGREKEREESSAEVIYFKKIVHVKPFEEDWWNFHRTHLYAMIWSNADDSPQKFLSSDVFRSLERQALFKSISFARARGSLNVTKRKINEDINFSSGSVWPSDDQSHFDLILFFDRREESLEFFNELVKINFPQKIKQIQYHLLKGKMSKRTRVSHSNSGWVAKAWKL